MTSHLGNVIESEGALILGAGVAGLFTALKLAPYPCLVLADERPGVSGSSAWAQGGIAASVGKGDTWQSHAADTVAAGAGLTDPEIAALVAREAPARINDLLSYGAPFDRDADGSIAVAREAAHSASRIVHVKGDRAGAEVMAALAKCAFAAPSIRFVEGYHAVELALENGRVVGVFARSWTSNADAPRLILIRAKAVVMATGGLGALYAVSTNPPESRGEGLGMAARAGAVIADPEFVQFHPTAIAVNKDPAPLATEALRGEGSILIDETGRRFMPSVHENAELAPRDVVARAIHREIAAGHKVFLDCTKSVGAEFPHHFPTVYQACKEAGIDPVTQPIPVAPAAHYHMGGIATDQRGRTSLEGLWAVGECASTGLHGANRLASNSLLEGLVFGARAAEDIKSNPAPAISHAALLPPVVSYCAPPVPRPLREVMSRLVGLERNEAGLKEALGKIAQIERAGGYDPSLLNMTSAARLVIAGALARQESRGSHTRTDYPKTDAHGSRNFLTLAEANRLAEEILPASACAAR
ncbi:L-aspartate oxidase [Rhizomicrobium palustre]|uniref:L-aspartate oxidase n=1 Tax=Rhizomicrobium palustre TaxID=189966 RepID=A0A846N2H4_9PROT|nr:L-aspartate oxidase [Rhizomicrobium palustre]NIK90138.1 L-aspartate oxidase [Rhizomicrobium palustre]